MKPEPRIVVSPLGQKERGLWKEFLGRSANGTLFHDLDFLDYHPVGRFRFEHLVLRQRGKVAALLPGGVVQGEEGDIFVSPLGASVGGAVVSPKLHAMQGLAMIQALQEYAPRRGWAGFDITLAPQVLATPASEILSFALFSRGFRLQNRWLCGMLDLDAADAPRYETFFNQSRRSFARAAKRKGVTIVWGGVELLPGFLEVFADTYTRHGVSPTHTPEEIALLLKRHPEAIRLCLAEQEGRCISGVLLFRIRPDAFYTFYICTSTEHAAEQGNVPLFAELLDHLAAEGIRWLDFGPMANGSNYNAGVTFFKESLGCVTYCRDRWSWRAAWTDGPELSRWNFMEEQ